jgi:hypothetical protein
MWKKKSIKKILKIKTPSQIVYIIMWREVKKLLNQEQQMSIQEWLYKRSCPLKP